MISHQNYLNLDHKCILSSQLTSMMPYDFSYSYRKLILKSDFRTS